MPDLQNDSPAGDPTSTVRWVGAGGDWYDEKRGLGVSTIEFKVAGRENSGMLILENTFHAQGGPPRHLHLAQDEWFYAVEGEFDVEVGRERRRLSPGDSMFAPRNVPHVWAHVGNGRGRILVAFTPAGQMEEFFRIVTAKNAMPGMDPALWRAHGMELLGPPLELPPPADHPDR